MSAKNAAKAVLLDGLSDLEQAALARKYETQNRQAIRLRAMRGRAGAH